MHFVLLRDERAAVETRAPAACARPPTVDVEPAPAAEVVSVRDLRVKPGTDKTSFGAPAASAPAPVLPDAVDLDRSPGEAVGGTGKLSITFEPALQRRTGWPPARTDPAGGHGFPGRSLRRLHPPRKRPQGAARGNDARKDRGRRRQLLTASARPTQRAFSALRARSGRAPPTRVIVSDAGASVSAEDDACEEPCSRSRCSSSASCGGTSARTRAIRRPGAGRSREAGRWRAAASGGVPRISGWHRCVPILPRHRARFQLQFRRVRRWLVALPAPGRRCGAHLRDRLHGPGVQSAARGPLLVRRRTPLARLLDTPSSSGNCEEAPQSSSSARRRRRTFATVSSMASARLRAAGRTTSRTYLP